ncbi:hypothetical protein J0H58_21625 [bacterium]|nr:hypothetical protein [bacterium]
MNPFARLDEYLNAALPAALGGAVTYTRGAQQIPVADAVVGRTVFSSNQQGAARVEFGDRDYLIPVASLTALGEPTAGDRITDVVNGVELTFQVQKPGTGEPAWRYSDPGRTTYRIHTKRVGS